jgi:hypothetical protein
MGNKGNTGRDSKSGSNSTVADEQEVASEGELILSFFHFKVFSENH